MQPCTSSWVISPSSVSVTLWSLCSRCYKASCLRRKRSQGRTAWPRPSLCLTLGNRALAVMACNCYAAICSSLLYGQVMSNELCVGLVWGSWGLAFLDAFINTLLAWNLDFCETQLISNVVCGIPSLFPLSCSNSSINFAVLLCSALLHALGSLLLVFFAYARIVATILSISPTTGRSKAFCTCSSPIIAVSLFYGSGVFRYHMPTSGSPRELIFPCTSVWSLP